MRSLGKKSAPRRQKAHERGEGGGLKGRGRKGRREGGERHIGGIEVFITEAPLS